MRAGYAEVLLSTLVAAAATLQVLNPFLPAMHAWWVAPATGLAGLYLLIGGLGTVLRGGGSRLGALAALGGALLAGGLVFAALLVGQPQRVPAVPGQTYRPPNSASVEVSYPDVTVLPSGAGPAWPDFVSVVEGRRTISARDGDVVRTGGFVFSVQNGPIAYVDARSPQGKPVTVTQPDGPAFLSPFLTFNGLDGDKPEDFFRVPALFRDVQVDYWSGLPSRGIDIPFLALRVTEQNDASGRALYEGVAVSGRPLNKAGVSLRFALGVYPVVMMSSAPPVLPFAAGAAMFAVGWIGFAARSLRSGHA